MNHEPESTIACLSDPNSEETLVVAAKSGDEQALETLFKRHQQRVLRIVLRYARVREDAEDIVQQSFQKAFVHLRRFEGKSTFSTWLTRIAINEALMFLRSIGAVREVSMDDAGDADGSSASLEIPDSRQDPEASYLQREWARVLLSALEDLGPGMRRAIELRELAELSTEQTALQMGLSVGAVKARIFHGRKKLRQRLRRYITSPRTLKTARVVTAARHASREICSPRSCRRVCEERGSHGVPVYGCSRDSRISSPEWSGRHDRPETSAVSIVAKSWTFCSTVEK